MTTRFVASVLTEGTVKWSERVSCAQIFMSPTGVPTRCCALSRRTPPPPPEAQVGTTLPAAF